jgi:hypothetical protein
MGTKRYSLLFLRSLLNASFPTKECGQGKWSVMEPKAEYEDCNFFKILSSEHIGERWNCFLFFSTKKVSENSSSTLIQSRNFHQNHPVKSPHFYLKICLKMSCKVEYHNIWSSLGTLFICLIDTEEQHVFGRNYRLVRFWISSFAESMQPISSTIIKRSDYY